LPWQIDQAESLAAQISAIVDAAHLRFTGSGRRVLFWINPPGYATRSFCAMARTAWTHWPFSIIDSPARPKQGPVPGYEVAELLGLQVVRDEARSQ